MSDTSIPAAGLQETEAAEVEDVGDALIRAHQVVATMRVTETPATPATPEIAELKEALETAIEAIDAAIAIPDDPRKEALCATAEALEDALDDLEAGKTDDIGPVIEQARSVVQS
jgi:hypothetical protein